MGFEGTQHLAEALMQNATLKNVSVRGMHFVLLQRPLCILNQFEILWVGLVPHRYFFSNEIMANEAAEKRSRLTGHSA